MSIVMNPLKGRPVGASLLLMEGPPEEASKALHTVIALSLLRGFNTSTYFETVDGGRDVTLIVKTYLGASASEIRKATEKASERLVNENKKNEHRYASKDYLISVMYESGKEQSFTETMIPSVGLRMAAFLKRRAVRIGSLKDWLPFGAEWQVGAISYETHLSKLEKGKPQKLLGLFW